MSMHEIEGLVEDSIILLNQSKKKQQAKRELIYNLYRFQALFDTGFTHFRVKEILIETGYLYQIPLKDYPPFKEKPEQLVDIEKTLEQQRGTWVDQYYAEKDSVSGAPILYFDYGSELWDQLVKNKTLTDSATPPSRLSITQLAYIIMQEAAEQKNKVLTLQWYVMTSNCFAEEYIDENAYKDFPAFITDSNVIESKALAIDAGIKTYKERDGYLTLQQWDDVKDNIQPDKLDTLFILRFWLDFETSNDDLLSAYNIESAKLKQLNKDGNKQKKINLIADELNKVLTKENGWTHERLSDTEHAVEWLWYADNKEYDEKTDDLNDDFYRQSIKVKFEREDQAIHCDLGLQHGKILRWQKQKPNTHPAFWHFYTNLMINSDEVMDQSIAKYKNRLDVLGLWKFRLSQSNKKLTESIHAFTDYLLLEGEKIFQTNLTEFNQNLFNRDSDKLMYIMEYGENDSGIIPDYVIFNSGIMIPLTFLFNAIDQVPEGSDISNNKMVKKHYQQYKNSYDELHPKGASKIYLEPLQSFKDLTQNGMPLMIHFYFINYFKDHMSKPT
ncbi:hypothetical protein GCM10009133_01730 [Cocleimonas flava]|uniref:Uncharacterized protein n=1 Tax=Cocleimonas flava TaxID=634765 RepID=A0A4R1EU15_9GAMM|nr:hypothetical protein [Cocleimonas flava]TCJ85147.1 hypothetical protein EV695_3113 [Cocleimonas flava]